MPYITTTGAENGAKTGIFEAFEQNFTWNTVESRFYRRTQIGGASRYIYL